MPGHLIRLLGALHSAMPRKAAKDARKEDEDFDKFLEILDGNEGEAKAAEEAKDDAGIKPTEVFGTSATFKDFMLRPELTKALQENTFEAPSIIQQEAIPSGIMGVDLLCQAQSGSGKTCVFVLTVLQQLKVMPGYVQCVCVAPTRELAYQIRGEFARFSSHIDGVSIACFTGGFPESKNRMVLEVDPPTIVVGTPGRLESLLARPNRKHEGPNAFLDLSHVQYFIIDECDQIMNDEKMRRDTKLIHAAVWGGLPSASMYQKRNGRTIKPSVNSAAIVAAGIKTAKRRIQTMMFSATMDEKALALARELYPVTAPSTTSTDSNGTENAEEAGGERVAIPVYSKRKEIFIDNPTKQLLSGIIQRVIMVLEKNKNAVLGGLLEALQFTQLVIFVSTCERAERLEYLLNSCGYKAICTHAHLPQDQREARCEGFREMKYKILVATDLLHRGIDIPAVNAVINYDMPEDPDIYLHRIGRAGRFSTYGLAITFCTPETAEEKAKRIARQEMLDGAQNNANNNSNNNNNNNNNTVSPNNNNNNITAANANLNTSVNSGPTEYVRRSNVEIFEDIQLHFAKPIPELVISKALDENLKEAIIIDDETLEGIKGWRKEKEAEKR